MNTLMTNKNRVIQPILSYLVKALVTLLMIMSVPTQAQTERGSEPFALHFAELAFQQQQYDLALRELQPLVETDDAGAHYLLAQMHERGAGVDKDPAQAIAHYRQAAEQGLEEAQMALAWAYVSGNGAAADLNAALSWFLAAAEQGNRTAKTQAGLLLQANSDPDSADQSIALFSEAAEAGDATAQFMLAVLYDQGIDVTLDRERALEWFHAAASQGHAEAQYRLADYYELGEGGLIVDHAEAIYWYKSAAMQGFGDAYYNLAMKYFFGDGVSVNVDKAIFWMTKADQAGILEAKEALAIMTTQPQSQSQSQSEDVK